MGALWIGESWPRSFGSGTGVASFDHGLAIPDNPFLELEGVTLLGGDAVLSFRDCVRLWLAYGRVRIDSDGLSLYDRDLQYWIAELVLEGRAVSPRLDPFYLGLRSSGWGTFDRDEGYLLDMRYKDTLGYNQRSLQAASLVLGWVPPGSYRLRIWNDRLPRAARSVRVSAGEASRVVVAVGGPTGPGGAPAAAEGR
jgi:hypothetical protein